MYKILCKDGMAKRGQLETVHGTVQTPLFMNVGTVGAIKGAVTTGDLHEINTQIMIWEVSANLLSGISRY